MSQATLTTPAGKLRTQSQRRYVLVRWTEHDGVTSPPRLVRRSDSLATIAAVKRRLQGRRHEFYVIYDTITKEEVTP